MFPTYVGPSTAATTAMRTNPLARLTAVHAATEIEFLANDRPGLLGPGTWSGPALLGASSACPVMSRRAAAASVAAVATRRKPRPPRREDLTGCRLQERAKAAVP